MKLKQLTHWTVATAQVGLSYYFLTGFFGMLYLQGRGLIKLDISGIFKEAVMLILFFWFQRQRSSTEDLPKLPTDDTPPNPSKPAAPANLPGAKVL